MCDLSHLYDCVLRSYLPAAAAAGGGGGGGPPSRASSEDASPPGRRGGSRAAAGDGPSTPAPALKLKSLAGDVGVLASIKHFAKDYGGDAPPPAAAATAGAAPVATPGGSSAAGAATPLWLLVSVRFEALPEAPRVAVGDAPAAKAKQGRVDRLAAQAYRERRLFTALHEIVLVPPGCTVGELKRHISAALADVYPVFRGMRIQSLVARGCAGLSSAPDADRIPPALASGSAVTVTPVPGFAPDPCLRHAGGREDWLVSCLCGTTDDDGERMLTCDTCGLWLHTRCNGIDEDAELGGFVCGPCAKKQGMA